MTTYTATSLHPVVNSRTLEIESWMQRIDAVVRRETERKNLAYYRLVEPAMPTRIVTDGDLLFQIAYLLLQNAVKFTTTGHVTFALRFRGPSFLLEVGDTGPGIPTYAAASILFGKRLDGDPTPGAGLPAVRRLVGALGGHLMMTSQPGEGSTFSVVLPLFDADDTKPLRP